MRILVVAATEMELRGLPAVLNQTRHDVSFGIHGVGMLQACYQLVDLVRGNYDFFIQCGVAGSYSDDIEPGDAVLVHAEILGDLGAEDHDRFLDVFDLGLSGQDDFPFKNGQLVNDRALQFDAFRKVNALSVNCVAGKMSTVTQRKQHFAAGIESMEGAAFHYCCLMQQVPFLQVRGISNKVEPRNKENWQMANAISASHLAVKNILDQLTTEKP